MRNDAVPETAALVGLSVVHDQGPMAYMIAPDPSLTISSIQPSPKRPKKTQPGSEQEGGAMLFVESRE